MTLIIPSRSILWSGWAPVGKFVFNKYYKECQSELKKRISMYQILQRMAK